MSYLNREENLESSSKELETVIFLWIVFIHFFMIYGKISQVNPLIFKAL